VSNYSEHELTMQDNDELLPDVRVAARYGVHPLTVKRWAGDAKLNFPEGIKINGRFYRRVRDLVAWERTRVAARTGKPSTA
jgi:hypothetical protein